MTADRHSKAEQKELIEDPSERARREVENGLLQFELVLDTVRKYVSGNTADFRLKPSLILRLQDAALRGIHPLAGTFRNTSVHISGSRHAPPEPFLVSEEVGALCDYVNDNWNKGALHLASFILWKLNWIHPFADGNGRTARAVSYLVMSISLGVLLPGTPTIPEQISVDKGPYYDALEVADAVWQEAGKVDVSKLETMLTDMLQRQLLSLPTLHHAAKQQLESIIETRIQNISADLKEKLFSTREVNHQLWSISDYLVLQLSGSIEISTSETRQAEMASPFPRLLATSEEDALEKIDLNSPYGARDDVSLDVDGHNAFWLAPDAILSLSDPKLRWSEEGTKVEWALTGALFLIRLGKTITSENFYKSFDLLIARYINKRV